MSSLVLFAIAMSTLAFFPARVRSIAALCVLWRTAIAVASSLSEGGLVGSESDAATFFRTISARAAGTAELDLAASFSSNGREMFLNFYAIVLRATGSPGSSMAAHLLSVVGAALCFLLISKSWMLITPGDCRGLRKVLLIYAFLPSVAAYQSYVLREVWQSLALLMVFFASLSWSKHGMRPHRMLLLVGGAALGATMHHALLITMLGVAGVSIAMAQGISLRSVADRPSRIVTAAFVVSLLALAFLPLAARNDGFQSLISGDLLEEASDFADGAARSSFGSRAYYGPASDIERPWTIVSGFLRYQFAPLPTQVGSALDVALLFENVFRAWLIWAWWTGRHLFEPIERRMLALGMATWFLVELVWSIGTVNWGTASRHHTMAFAVLLIVGWVSWRRRLSPTARRSMIRGQSPLSRNKVHHQHFGAAHRANPQP